MEKEKIKNVAKTICKIGICVMAGVGVLLSAILVTRACSSQSDEQASVSKIQRERKNVLRQPTQAPFGVPEVHHVTDKYFYADANGVHEETINGISTFAIYDIADNLDYGINILYQTPYYLMAKGGMRVSAWVIGDGADELTDDYRGLVLQDTSLTNKYGGLQNLFNGAMSSSMTLSKGDYYLSYDVNAGVNGTMHLLNSSNTSIWSEAWTADANAKKRVCQKISVSSTAGGYKLRYYASVNVQAIQNICLTPVGECEYGNPILISTLYRDVGHYLVVSCRGVASFADDTNPNFKLYDADTFSGDRFLMPNLWYPWQVSGGVANEKGSPLFMPDPSDTRFSIVGSTTNVVQITKDMGLFVSKGLIFNRVRFNFRSWHKLQIGFLENGTWKGAEVPSGYWLLYKVEYLTIDGSGYDAWDMQGQELLPSPVEGKTCYQYLNASWFDGRYRTITLVSYEDSQYQQFYNGSANRNVAYWWSWLSQQDMSGFLPSAVTDITNGVDVFGLISTAMYGILPILAIPILGNMTLGLLLLLPLVAGIIVLIVKAVKK